MGGCLGSYPRPSPQENGGIEAKCGNDFNHSKLDSCSHPFPITPHGEFRSSFDTEEMKQRTKFQDSETRISKELFLFTFKEWTKLKKRELSYFLDIYDYISDSYFPHTDVNDIAENDLRMAIITTISDEIKERERILRHNQIKEFDKREHDGSCVLELGSNLEKDLMDRTTANFQASKEGHDNSYATGEYQDQNFRQNKKKINLRSSRSETDLQSYKDTVEEELVTQNKPEVHSLERPSFKTFKKRVSSTVPTGSHYDTGSSSSPRDENKDESKEKLETQNDEILNPSNSLKAPFLGVLDEGFTLDLSWGVQAQFTNEGLAAFILGKKL